MGDDAGGDGHPERLRLAVELTQQHARLGPCGSSLGIDADPSHLTEVDDQAAVHGRQAGEAVPPASHGDRESRPAPEPHGRDDVRHAGAPRDQGGAAVDRAVPDLPVLIVGGISGANDRSAEGGFEVAQRRLVDLDVGSDGAHGGPSWPGGSQSAIKARVRPAVVVPGAGVRTRGEPAGGAFRRDGPCSRTPRAAGPWSCPRA